MYINPGTCTCIIIHVHKPGYMYMYNYTCTCVCMCQHYMNIYVVHCVVLGMYFQMTQEGGAEVDCSQHCLPVPSSPRPTTSWPAK